MTAGEIKKIEYPQNPLKRTESEQTVDEQMDPPSFTKKLLMIEMKQCGQLITEEEAEHYQKILKQKAEKINIKLNNQLDPASDAEED